MTTLTLHFGFFSLEFSKRSSVRLMTQSSKQLNNYSLQLDNLIVKKTLTFNDWDIYQVVEITSYILIFSSFLKASQSKILIYLLGILYNYKEDVSLSNYKNYTSKALFSYSDRISCEYIAVISFFPSSLGSV